MISIYNKIFSKWRKTTATALLVTLSVNIFGSSLILAAGTPADPIWINNQIAQNKSSIEQVDNIVLPKNLQIGDKVSLDILNGSGVNNYSVFFSDSSKTEFLVMTELVAAINFASNNISGVSAVLSSTGGLPEIIVTSNVPNISIGQLSITRVLQPTYSSATTAIAQKALVSIPQTMDSNDTLYLTISGTLLTQTGADRADVMTGLMTQINSLGFVTATIVSSTDLEILSNTRGIDFALSDVSIVSTNISSVTDIYNVYPEPQIEEYKLARPIYGGETLTASISGVTVSGVDPGDLITNINNSSLSGTILGSISASGNILVESKIPGLPFGTGDLNISGGNVTLHELVPNRVAVAQVDNVILPRPMVSAAGITDIISLDLKSGVNPFNKTFTGTSLSELVSKINLDGGAALVASGIVLSQTGIELTSVTRGSPFTITNVKIDTQIDSQNVHQNVVPMAQSSYIDFSARVPVANDEITLYLGGNKITKTFSGTIDETLNSIMQEVVNSSLSLTGSVTGNRIDITSTIAGMPFSLSDATIINTTTPQVLTSPENPVKQMNTYTLKNEILVGDELSVSLGNVLFTGSDLTTLTTGIIGLSTVGSDNTALIISGDAGQSFVGSNLVTTSATFYTGSMIDSIEIPRELVSGDNLSLTISGITISQHITSNTGADLDNFKNVLKLVDNNIDYSFSGTHVVFSGSSLLESGNIVNTVNPVISVAKAGEKQRVLLPIPAYVSAGDELSFTLDGTKFTNTFNTDNATTFSSLSLAGFTFDAVSMPAGLLITAVQTGSIFTISPLDIKKNIISSNSVMNVPGESQVDTLSLPFDPFPGDIISADIKDSLGNIHSFSGVVGFDSTVGILSYLDTQLSTLTGVVNSSLDINSKTLTLTATVPGNGFSGSLSILGAGIPATTPVENSGALARQVEYSFSSRAVSSGDSLSIYLEQGSLSGVFMQDYAGSRALTLTGLADNINAYFTGTDLVATFDEANSRILIESEIPEVDFISGPININTNYKSETYCDSSAKCHVNVPAVAQIDHITFSRPIIDTDVLSLDFSGFTSTGSQFYQSGITSNTLTGLIANFNTTLASVADTSLLGANNDSISIVSLNPGFPFEINNIVVTNTPFYSGSIIANVPPVYPTATIDFGAYGNGDVVSLDFSFADTPYFSGSVGSLTGTDLNTVVSSINSNFGASLEATASGTELFLVGKQDSDLTVNSNIANVSIINSAPSFIPAVAQIEEVVPTTANGDFGASVIEDWTMELSISTNGGANNDLFSYNTQSSDTIDTVVDNFYQIISNSGTLTDSGILLGGSGGVLVSSGVSSTGVTAGLRTLIITANTPGIPFSTTTNIADYKMPVISGPDQTLQTLKTGDSLSITGTITSDEPGIMYLVQTGITLDNSGITAAITNNQASMITSANSPAKVNISTSLIVPNLQDGLYNIVTTDKGSNFSNAFTGFLVVDNTSPLFSVDTNGFTYNTSSSFMINADTIMFSGVIESGSTMTIAGSGVAVIGNTFNATFPLFQDSNNSFTFTGADSVGNTRSITLDIYEKSTTPNLTISNPDYSISQNTAYTITGTTDTGVIVNIFDSNNILKGSANSTASGTYSASITLAQNVTNTFTVIATDMAMNSKGLGVHIIHDDVAPGVSIFNQSGSTVNYNNVTIFGKTEANIQVQVGAGIVTSDLNGNFSSNTSLALGNNDIVITATDKAGNVGSQNVLIIYEAPNPNLTVNTASTITNAANITISGSTNPNSPITINGGSSLVSGAADSTGNFSFIVPLNVNVLNNLAVTSNYFSGLFVTSSVFVLQDSTLPTISISTSAGVTSNDIFTITGTTEAGASVSVTGGSGVTAVVADNLGFFTINVTLNQDAINSLILHSIDLAGNTASASLNITHTSNPFFLIANIVGPIDTSGSTISVNGAATPWDMLTFSGQSNSGFIVVGQYGDFTINNIGLVEGNNIIKLTLTNGSGATKTASFAVTRDSISPVISLSTLSQSTSANSINVAGNMSENNVQITISGGKNLASGNTGTGNSFSIPVNLNTNTTNNLIITANDSLGNVSTANLAIVHADVVVKNPDVGTGGGGGGGSAYITIDNCPNGDFSPSYYDFSCGTANAGNGDTTNTSTGGVITDGNANDTSVTETDQLVIKYILKIKKEAQDKDLSEEQKISIWKKMISDSEDKLKNNNISDKNKSILEKIIKAAKAELDNTSNPENIGNNGSEEVVDPVVKGDTKIEEIQEISKFIPVDKYIDVEHMIVIRDFASYKGKIIAYLPRNYRVTSIEAGNIWTKISFDGIRKGFIRTKYLRDQNKQDRGRTASIKVFYDTSLQTDVDMRKVKVARSLFVRKGPGVDNKITGVLKKNDNVLVLDTKTINGWYEIRWTGGNGWVNGKYIEEVKK